MFKKNNIESEGSNFWISYADLMAGLLFVFILLIGAIVSKSIILKDHLHKKESALSSLSYDLEEKDKKLIELHKIIKDNKQIIFLRNQEVENLKNVLFTANAENVLLNKKLVLVENKLIKINISLADKKQKLIQENNILNEYKGNSVILSKQLEEMNKTLKNKDIKLVELINFLELKEIKYQKMVTNMQIQKAKIKSLTGIRIKVIAALKNALGNKINIDKKSGSLKLASNILFDKGSAILKEVAKVELKEAFEEYIGALLSNSMIRSYLDKIIIEGHTDSDGEYLYNLNLSQQRAYAVMHFLFSLDFSKKNNIQPLLTASGRAYLDTILVKGKEDKEASRRIEIKFKLKNEDAMHEIEKVLDGTE